MEAIIRSDAYGDLKEEIQKLQLVLANVTSERDDLKYHVCPELEARYAQEIGDFQNRINYQKIIILETKRRIEIARAALNREKTISREDVDKKVHEEYQDFHKKVDEEFRKAEQAKREQREREERQRQYRKKWQEQFGGGSDGNGSGDSTSGGGDRKDGTSGGENGGGSYGTGSSGHGNSGGTGDNGDGGSGGANKHEVPNLKELYRKIIKRLHPDVNPNITEREKELFNKAVQAYENGDVVTLQEIYDEVFGDDISQEAQKELSYEELAALRDKLKERIEHILAEIEAIRQRFPYTEKEFLDDPEAVKEKREELERQIRANEETLRRLLKILEEIGQEMEELRKRKA